MAIINSYPTTTPTGSDLIIGTDVSTTPNSTKTFTIDSINALSTGTPAAGTSNTVALFTSAVAVGNSTIVRSGAGATSVYTFGGGTAISNTSITTSDLTTSGNTILGNAGTDALTINAAATFTDNITMNGSSKNLTLGVTNPIIFIDGAGAERLRIAGDVSNNSIIQDSSSGDLILISNTELEIKSGLLGENYAKFTKDGPIELYYDNVKKFETSASGVLLTGSLTTTGDVILPDNAKLEIGSATGGDLQIYHDGSNSYIDEQGTGNLIIKGSTNVLISTSSGAQLAQFTDTGSAFLYHSGSLKFSTTANGVTISGQATVPTTPVAATDAASKAYVDGIVGYTTYVARVTQAGTAAPVATIIANDTGLTFTWARTGTGVFTVTPSSAFVVNKTWIQMTGGNVSTGVTMVTVKNITTASANAVNSNLINGAAADGITAAFVEIRIYP